MGKSVEQKPGLVSVIIPSFKMGQFIGEALESVGLQTYPHWEVIVVDDAGPEGSHGGTEVGGWRLDDGGQRPDGGGQMTEVRDWRSEEGKCLATDWGR